MFRDVLGFRVEDVGFRVLGSGCDRILFQAVCWRFQKGSINV